MGTTGDHDRNEDAHVAATVRFAFKLRTHTHRHAQSNVRGAPRRDFDQEPMLKAIAGVHVDVTVKNGPKRLTRVDSLKKSAVIWSPGPPSLRPQAPLRQRRKRRKRRMRRRRNKRRRRRREEKGGGRRRRRKRRRRRVDHLHGQKMLW